MSVCAPDKATLKANNHALQCTTAGPYHAIPSYLLGVGSICGLGPDLVGTSSISLSARYRVAACSTTLTKAFRKIKRLVGTIALLFSLSLPSGRTNGIVVMGFLVVFVYTHHLHRRILENPGNFGDCMKGRIRFMKAITPAYVHAYQATCLSRHMPAVPHQNFRQPKAQGQISVSFLLLARSTTRERGNDFSWMGY